MSRCRGERVPAVTHMDRFDFSKIVFYATCVTGVLGLSFAFGLYSGANQTVVYDVLAGLKAKIEDSLNITKEEAPTLAKIHPKNFLQPARYQGHGVTVNKVVEPVENFVLLSGFFGDSNEIRLIRRDGSVIARWPAQFSAIFEDTSHLIVAPTTDWNVDIHGALARPDGSVVFNFEYYGLVKLDRCGDVVWTVPRETHHSVEVAEGGGYWVPARRRYGEGSRSPYPPFTPPFMEDTVVKISEQGEVVAEISVPKLFYDSGLETLLTATGKNFVARKHPDFEIVHLNKITELPSALAVHFPNFRAGDLALSLRQRNLIMVIDPNTRKIKWWKVGPWVRQHDPEFSPRGTIVVFNNNAYKIAYGDGPEISSPTMAPVSNVIEIDPRSGRHRAIFGGKPGQEMLSVIRGKMDLTPKGGLLITEFEGGRVFETNSEGDVVWEYINRYSAAEVAEITEARIYPASYFTVSDWSCDKPGD